MAAFVGRRLLALPVLLLLITFLVYSLVFLLPGDPARSIAGGLNAPEEQVEEVREELGLDDPLLVQYGRWVKGIVTGDLGESLFSARPVAEELQTRFPVTLSIALGAVFLAVLIGVPVGILAGTRPGSLVDRIVTFGSSLGVAIPDFFLATVLVVFFAVERDWFPSIGYVGITEDPVEWARHLVLPWIALGVSSAATLSRQVRGAMIDVLEQDYIRTARAKGLPERRVLGRHALKNALTPALTVVGIQFAYLLGGTLIIETIFSLPGIGTYLIQAVITLDLPVIQGVTLLVAVLFVFMNLLVDVLYGFLNPKIRLS